MTASLASSSCVLHASPHPLHLRSPCSSCPISPYQPVVTKTRRVSALRPCQPSSLQVLSSRHLFALISRFDPFDFCRSLPLPPSLPATSASRPSLGSRSSREISLTVLVSFISGKSQTQQISGLSSVPLYRIFGIPTALDPVSLPCWHLFHFGISGSTPLRRFSVDYSAL